MDAEIKAKWVQALRSGRYLQGKAVLRTEDNHFCCLGVLCDIAEVRWEMRSYGRYMAIASPNDMHSTLLPADVQRRADISATGTLINLNETGSTFTEIADYIERFL